MPTVTRELSITYGGLTVGGASDLYLLTDRYIHEETYETSRITFYVVCRADTEAGFKAAAVALEAAFRKPWQSTTVTLGANILVSWDHATNTGYLATPSIRKMAGPEDTGRSRKYECNVEVQRAADLVGQSFRRDSRVELTTEPSGRKARLRISGAYTANSTTGASARTQYEASIAAYTLAVQTAIGPGIIWQKLGEMATADDQDKNLDFSVEYEQVPTDVADSGLRNLKLSISRERIAPGDTPGRGTRRLATFRAVLSGEVPFGVDPRIRWETVTRPWLLGKIRSVFVPSVLAVAPDTVSIDYITNAINADVTALGVDGSNTLQYTQTVVVHDEIGNTIAPVWNKDPLAAYLFAAPEVILRTTTDLERVLGDKRRLGASGKNGVGGGLNVGIDIGGVGVQFGGGGGGGGGFRVGIDIGTIGIQIGQPGFADPGGGAGAGGGGAGNGPGGSTWVPISNERSETALELGLPGERFVVTDINTVVVERAVKIIPPVIFTQGGGP